MRTEGVRGLIFGRAARTRPVAALAALALAVPFLAGAGWGPRPPAAVGLRASGLVFSVLCDFRAGLLGQGVERRFLVVILALCTLRRLLRGGGRVRTAWGVSRRCGCPRWWSAVPGR